MPVYFGCSIQAAGSSCAANAVALLLSASVSNKGSENESIGDCSGGKDFERGKQRPELLVRIAVNDTNDAVDGDRDED